jgi:hypothetical protein
MKFLYPLGVTFALLSVFTFSWHTRAQRLERSPEGSVETRSKPIVISHAFPRRAGCSLKTVTLGTQVYSSEEGSLTKGSLYRATSMAASFETTSPECLREYGLVQWVRGCVYSEAFDQPHHEVSFGGWSTRDHRGVKSVDFYHPEWVIDTLESDPMYGTSPESTHLGDPNDRHRFYLAAPSGQNFTVSDYFQNLWKPINLFRLVSPRLTQIGVRDFPTGGTVQFHPVGDALGKILLGTQVALQFRLCIYPITKIPIVGDPEGEPLHCFSWSSQHLLDWERRDWKTDAVEVGAHCKNIEFNSNL